MDKVIIGIHVLPEERDLIHQLARANGFEYTSDYIRHLIEQDAEKQGVSIKFNVDRGGFRKAK